MRIPCGIWRHPNGKPAQIKVKAYFSCFKLNFSDFILFLLDTGALGSLMSEADAKKLGIDYDSLQLLPEDQWATGIGGKSPLYRIKAECKIIFRTDQPITKSGGGFHVETLDHFDVVKVNITDVKIREEVIANLPSLLGMGLLPKFKLVATGEQAYLEL